MYVSFISFITRELNTLALFGTSLGVTTFLGITICKTILIDIESIDMESICEESFCIKGACIKAFCNKVICIGNVSIRDTYRQGVCIDNISSKKTYARSTYIGDIYMDSNDAIESLEIHLQSFQILEAKLFSTRLETGIEFD